MTGRFVNVVDIPTPDLMDVPASLRRLADLIESGEEPAYTHAIVVCESDDGRMRLYGYGKVGDRAREIGTLYMAALQMATTE